MVIGGSAGVGVGVPWTNAGQDECTTAVFVILYLHSGGLDHRLLPAQPHHLWIRVSCQDGRQDG